MTEQKILLFLGTGSGLSPLRCIIDDLLKTQNSNSDYFYLGLRFPSDVFWKDYFENLEKEYPNFHYVLLQFPSPMKLGPAKPDTLPIWSPRISPMPQRVLGLPLRQ
jgi:Na+-transporting NADH:ubiquinone oxidoreductase subunit NqrF